MKQTFGKGRRAKHTDCDGTRGFAEYRHPLRIATETGDVSSNPLQPRNHVQKAVVAGRVAVTFSAQLWVRQKAEHPKTVADGDHDNAFLRQPLPVVQLLGWSACREAAAVDPDHYREFLVRAFGRSPDVEKQAIFTGRG